MKLCVYGIDGVGVIGSLEYMKSFTAEHAESAECSCARVRAQLPLVVASRRQLLEMTVPGEEEAPKG